MSSLLSSLLGNQTQVINLDSNTFKQQLKNDKDAVLIDVRTAPEHQDARIPNSKLINLMDPNFINEIERLDKSKSYYLYCRSGSRSYTAGREMRKRGFEKVYNLESGIICWTGEIER